ncbi:hypothetical protein [Dickeya chrysanthemi]|uniref:hypothetical protein n=1 Tax=Dickeya chrysanthemi TaxID=556 RepID=UPI000A851D70|nr:hypothetical protein [Dickeya chrysanthemi]
MPGPRKNDDGTLSSPFNAECNRQYPLLPLVITVLNVYLQPIVARGIVISSGECT